MIKKASIGETLSSILPNEPNLVRALGLIMVPFLRSNTLLAWKDSNLRNPGQSRVP